MKKVFLSFFLVGTIMTSYAQSGSFLNLPTDAQGTAMGFTSSVSSTYNSAMFSNFTTTLESDNKYTIGYTYIPWGDYTLKVLNAYTLIGRKSALGFGYRNFDHPSISVMDSEGNYNGTFSPNEKAFSLGYAYLFNEHLSMGITGHYISSDMYKKANTFAADLSASYKKDNWKIGVTCTNFGGKLDYGESSYNLPSRINIGGAYTMNLGSGRLTGALQLTSQILPSEAKGTEYGLGAEYVYSFLTIRGGYRIADEEKTGPSILTLGAGIHWEFICVDLAYTSADSDTPADNNTILSIGINF